MLHFTFLYNTTTHLSFLGLVVIYQFSNLFSNSCWLWCIVMNGFPLSWPSMLLWRLWEMYYVFCHCFPLISSLFYSSGHGDLVEHMSTDVLFSPLCNRSWGNSNRLLLLCLINAWPREYVKRFYSYVSSANVHSSFPSSVTPRVRMRRCMFLNSFPF